jgi:hypothetical protein
MNNKQQTAKGPRDLFREIDALCNEVDSATPNVDEAEKISPMQRALEDQEYRDRAKRKNQYSQLLFCRLIDVEVQPFESPRDRASITIRSAVECFQNSVEIAEGFALVELLLSHDFILLSTGKIRRDKDPMENDDRVFTWFILSEPNTM